jgi:hypothetical protein
LKGFSLPVSEVDVEDEEKKLQEELEVNRSPGSFDDRNRS